MQKSKVLTVSLPDLFGLVEQDAGIWRISVMELVSRIWLVSVSTKH